jgi:hypothetical protein
VLVIAERFHAGLGNEVKSEPGEGRKKLSVVPLGLNKKGQKCPALKTLGYFQFAGK